MPKVIRKSIHPANVTATPAPQSRAVLEYTIARGREALKVDRDKGIIYGVKILGVESKNGHRYTLEALKSAVPLYEGAKVNCDHPAMRRADGERSVKDRFGKLVNVRYVQGETLESTGLYADLHCFTQGHAKDTFEQLCEAAEKPELWDTLGFSHNAVVNESVKDGQVLYHEITRVRSVDLVADPATTRGIFESERIPAMDEEEAVAAQGAPPVVEPVDDDEDDEYESSALDQTIDEFVQKCLAGEIDKDELKSKISDAIDLHIPDADDDEEGEDENAEECTTESVHADPPAAAAKDTSDKTFKAMSVLESAGVPVTAIRVKAVMALESEADQKALAETWKGQPAKQPAPKPRSTPALESQRDPPAATVPGPSPMPIKGAAVKSFASGLMSGRN